MTGVDASLFERAIDRLYEAALEPELWSNAIEHLGAAMGGYGGCCLELKNGNAGWGETSRNFKEPLNTFLQEGWGHRNARTERGLSPQYADVEFVTDTSLFAPGELDRQPIQREFFARYDLRSFIGFQLVPGRMLISIERGLSEVQGWELATLATLTPHLRRAGTLAFVRGQARADGVLDGLALLNCPAFLLDQDGLLISANSEAEPLLQSLFSLRGGRAVPLFRAQASAYQRLIAHATSVGALGSEALPPPVSLPRAAGRPVLVHALPMTGEGRRFFGNAKAVVILLDPDRGGAPKHAEFQLLFGFTPTEARVARSLTMGRDLNRTAAELNLSRETVRTHVSALFAKTGTHKQAELVALIYRAIRFLPSRP